MSKPRFVGVTEGEDRVIARMRRHLRGKSSGIELDYDYWVGFVFEEGRGIRIEWFASGDEAVAALGLG